MIDYLDRSQIECVMSYCLSNTSLFIHYRKYMVNKEASLIMYSVSGYWITLL